MKFANTRCTGNFLILDGTIADTAGICITKAMSGPLTGGTAEAAAKPWLIPAGKYFAAHHLQGQHPLQVVCSEVFPRRY